MEQSSTKKPRKPYTWTEEGRRRGIEARRKNKQRSADNLRKARLVMTHEQLSERAKKANATRKARGFVWTSSKKGHPISEEARKKFSYPMALPSRWS